MKQVELDLKKLCDLKKLSEVLQDVFIEKLSELENLKAERKEFIHTTREIIASEIHSMGYEEACKFAEKHNIKKVSHETLTPNGQIQ